MVHFTKQQIDELLADCASEALNEYLDTCTTEELAMLICVARTMCQHRDDHHVLNSH